MLDQFGLLGLGYTRLPSPPQWIAVRERFRQLDAHLALTDIQRANGLRNAENVVTVLNRHYYGIDSGSANAFLNGSWARGTAIRPPRDLDVCFKLSPEVYARFECYSNNRQSALLHEVKTVIAATYPRTAMRGDGQVVVVDFGSFCVEVVPVFELQSGRFLICDTHEGGAYPVTDPAAQDRHVEYVNKTCAGNLLPLVRMAKAWQQHCSVNLPSFAIELLMTNFLSESEWRMKGWLYFDWLFRDFFAYLLRQRDSLVLAPGTYDRIFLGDSWYSRAKTAYGRTLQACDLERDNEVQAAGHEWRKVFGDFVPVSP